MLRQTASQKAEKQPSKISWRTTTVQLYVLPKAFNFTLLKITDESWRSTPWLSDWLQAEGLLIMKNWAMSGIFWRWRSIAKLFIVLLSKCTFGRCLIDGSCFFVFFKRYIKGRVLRIGYCWHIDIKAELMMERVTLPCVSIQMHSFLIQVKLGKRIDSA